MWEPGPTCMYPEITGAVKISHTSITNSYVENLGTIVRRRVNYVTGNIDPRPSDVWQIRRASATHTSFPGLVVASSFSLEALACVHAANLKKKLLQPSSRTCVRIHINKEIKRGSTSLGDMTRQNETIRQRAMSVSDVSRTLQSWVSTTRRSYSQLTFFIKRKNKSQSPLRIAFIHAVWWALSTSNDIILNLLLISL